LRLLGDMEKKGLAPNVITYGASISSCEREGEIVGSVWLMKRAFEGGLCREFASVKYRVDMLDLHYLPLHTAKAIIRFVLEVKKRRQFKTNAAECADSSRLVIVTERGNHALLDGIRGVLREEVEVFLRQELMLEVTVPPKNPGRSLVTCKRMHEHDQDLPIASAVTVGNGSSGCTNHVSKEELDVMSRSEL
jgi:hypothetical protein